MRTCKKSSVVQTGNGQTPPVQRWHNHQCPASEKVALYKTKPSAQFGACPNKVSSNWNGGKEKSGQDLDDLSFSSADFDPDKKTATQDVNEQSEKCVEFEQEIERGRKILPETTEDCGIIKDESRINEVSNAASSRVHVDVPSYPTKEELGYE